MGYYKNQGLTRADVRRYNAAARKAAKLVAAEDKARLIRLETVSEIERYETAKDADAAFAYNRDVEQWQQQVTSQLRQTVAVKSLRISQELAPKAYKDKYGLIDRLGFSFPRHGIYLHYGAGRGQGGYKGSHWNKLKKVGGVEVDTGIVRHTDPKSLNMSMGTGNRKAFEWFDPVIKRNIGKLEKIVMDYFDTMIVDATRIYINK